MRKYVSRWSGSFKVPARMMEWLGERLGGHPHQIQAVALAALAMRVWAAPGLIEQGSAQGFPLAREEIAKILGLTVWEVRRAIAVLVEIGFITRGETGAPRRTGRGIRRPPILYRLALSIVGYFRRLISKRPPISNAPRGELSSLQRKENLPGEALLTGGPLIDGTCPRVWTELGGVRRE